MLLYFLLIFSININLNALSFFILERDGRIRPNYSRISIFYNIGLRESFTCLKSYMGSFQFFIMFRFTYDSFLFC